MTPSNNTWGVCERNMRAQDVPHQRNWSCIIEPSRTGTSLRLPNRYSPPTRTGSQDVPVLGLFVTQANLHSAARGVMTPILGSLQRVIIRVRNVHTRRRALVS